MRQVSLETLSVVSAIGGLLGAVGGAIAALAAFRSAGSAKRAVEQGIALERRRDEGSAMAAAQEMQAKRELANELGNELKQAYTTLFVFGGGGAGSSREQIYVNAVDEKLKNINSLANLAGKYVEDIKLVSKLSAQELEEASRKFSGDLSVIENVCDKFRFDLLSVEEKNRVSRERQLNRPK